MRRRFTILGRKARADDGFLLDDLPGTSGRLDVLARCLRAAFLSSHGLRAEVVVYLVLLGGPRAPRVVRLDGSAVRFLRPDERSLSVLLKKVLASRADDAADGFVLVKPGIAVARGGLAVAVADAGVPPVLLEEGAADVRRAAELDGEVLFVIGDHLGIPDDVRAELGDVARVSVGPVSIHADDVVAVLTNELDRRALP